MSGCLCHCVFCTSRVCADHSSLFLSISGWFTVGLNHHDTHTHTQRKKRPHPSPSHLPAALFFKRCVSCVFFGRPLCNLLMTLGLCMWEMCQRPTESCDWLTGHTPPNRSSHPTASKPGVLRRSSTVTMATVTSGWLASCKYPHFPFPDYFFPPVSSITCVTLSFVGLCLLCRR